MTECVFVPAHEPWQCNVHNGVRTSLDEPQCDIARPAEPLNDAYLDNIRQGIAEGRNPSSRYVTRRLLATIDALRSPSTGDDRLREAARAWSDAYGETYAASEALLSCGHPSEETDPPCPEVERIGAASDRYATAVRGLRAALSTGAPDTEEQP